LLNVSHPWFLLKESGDDVTIQLGIYSHYADQSEAHALLTAIAQQIFLLPDGTEPAPLALNCGYRTYPPTCIDSRVTGEYAPGFWQGVCTYQWTVER
jgi:hypothetical protein